MSVQTDLQRGSKPFKQPEILFCKGFWYFKFVGAVKQNHPRKKVNAHGSMCQAIINFLLGFFLSEKQILKKSEADEHFRQWIPEELPPWTSPQSPLGESSCGNPVPCLTIQKAWGWVVGLIS